MFIPAPYFPISKLPLIFGVCPNILGTGRIGGASDSYGSLYDVSGALYRTSKSYHGRFMQIAQNSGDVAEMGFKASISNSLFGKSSIVQPPSLQALLIIKI